jgi:hypothetical protein
MLKICSFNPVVDFSRLEDEMQAVETLGKRKLLYLVRPIQDPIKPFMK